MSSEWPLRALGELTINYDGRRRPVKESERKAGPYPYYGASGIVDHVDSFIFEGRHLLIGEDGENLRTRQTPIAFLAEGKYWVNNHAHIVTGNDQADTRYLLYALLNAEISPYLSGAVMPKLTQGNLNRIPLPCPPRATQEAIVSVLGTLDDRIVLLRETNATLEAIAQALFKSWFVDFDPVRARQQGVAPAGMDEATAALFPDSLSGSSFGPLPEGWRTGTLADMADLNVQSWSTRHHPERVRYLDLANVKSNEVAAVAEFAFDEAPSRARRVLRYGDTIIGTVRPGNRSFAFIHQPAPGLTGSTGFAVLSPKIVDHAAFVYLAATQDASIEHLSHVADGGAYPAVRPDVVSALTCVVPSVEVLCAFNRATLPLLERVSTNQLQAETLATLRDTLLPRLISGQLRLPEAEAMLAET